MRIVVDLTPVLPGGLNGGAKSFVLRLVHDLIGLAPDDEFVLLTSYHAHEELEYLDAPNARRQCVVGAPPPPDLSRPSLQRRLRFGMARVLPERAMLQIELAYLVLKGQRQRRRRVLLELGADLLFAPFTAVFFHEPGVPVVSLVHDLQVFAYPRFFAPGDRAARQRDFFKAAQVVDRFTCTTQFVRNTILEHRGIQPERVVAIHPRMFLRLPSPDPLALRRRGLVEGQFLVFPANFWPHKNHRMLLTAFGLYRAQHPESELKLVCLGEHVGGYPELRRAASAMHLQDAVVWPGFVSEQELAALYETCLALVFPSLYEGFGLPVLEAMALGAPVICSRSASLPEVAGQAAVYVDPRKPFEIVRAIEQVATDPALRGRLREAGRARVAALGQPVQTAREYLALFRERSHVAAPEALELTARA